MYYKKDLIVAYKLNGEALPEEYWPLRLVGEGIEAADMVGQSHRDQGAGPGPVEGCRADWLMASRRVAARIVLARGAVLLCRGLSVWAGLLGRRRSRRRRRRPASACSSPAA